MFCFPYSGNRTKYNSFNTNRYSIIRNKYKYNYKLQQRAQGISIITYNSNNKKEKDKSIMYTLKNVFVIKFQHTVSEILFEKKNQIKLTITKKNITRALICH